MRRKEARDEEFTAFVENASQRLLRYCFLLTGRDAQAQDLLQASLVKVYITWDRIRNKDTVEAYARTVITRTHVSNWRRRGSRELVMDEVPDRSVEPVDVDLTDAMWRLLARLGARQRAAVVLRYYHDLPEAEIAVVLGCSIGTVKSQISRALANLRQLAPDADLTFEGGDGDDA